MDFYIVGFEPLAWDFIIHRFGHVVPSAPARCLRVNLPHY